MNAMDCQWGSLSGVFKKERRGKRAELPEEVAKKLKSCSVLNCEEWRDLSDTSTTYHCFPTGDKNQQRWEIWTSLLQKSRDDSSWIPFRGSLVCSHHFKATDFVQDPNQKRRKLVKNAIPSVFPTFLVDLDDPSFALEDSNDATGTMDNGENENYIGNEGSYYYDDEEDNEYDYGYEQEPAIPEVNVVEYQDDQDVGEDDLQMNYVLETQHKQQRTISNKLPLPKLTPANSYSRKLNEYESVVNEPPRKKMSMNGNGGSSQPQRIISQTYSMNGIHKPPLSFKGASSTNNAQVGLGNTKSTSSRRAFPDNSKTTFQNSKNNSSSSSTSKLYQQLCKSMPNTKFPMSWNSDLEIEVVQTKTDDSSTISTLKQQVEELETENETLKLKFSAQIRALQRKIKEQDKIINEYVAHFNFSSIGEDS